MLTTLVHLVVSNPWIFDRVQYLLGFKQTCRRLTPFLSQTHNKVVLDIGGGTGNFASVLPQSASYLCLDIDLKKLRRFKIKYTSGQAILGDATRICLKDKSVDYALCIALAHHLSDSELALLFSELARVIRKSLIFLDPVEHKESKISNLLWKYDRGSYSRSVQALYSAIEPWFEIDQTEHYALYHHYILCASKPRRRN